MVADNNIDDDSISQSEARDCEQREEAVVTNGIIPLLLDQNPDEADKHLPPKARALRKQTAMMNDFVSESESDYTSYWRDWVRCLASSIPIHMVGQGSRCCLLAVLRKATLSSPSHHHHHHHHCHHCHYHNTALHHILLSPVPSHHPRLFPIENFQSNPLS